MDALEHSLSMTPVCSLLMCRMVCREWKKAVDKVFSWKGVFNLGEISLHEEAGPQLSKLPCPTAIAKNPQRTRQNIALLASLDEQRRVGLDHQTVDLMLSPYYRETQDGEAAFARLLVNKSWYKSLHSSVQPSRVEKQRTKASFQVLSQRQTENPMTGAVESCESLVPTGLNTFLCGKRRGLEVWRWFTEADVFSISMSGSSVQDIEKLNATPFGHLLNPQLRRLFSLPLDEAVQHVAHFGHLCVVWYGEQRIVVIDLHEIDALLNASASDIVGLWKAAVARTGRAAEGDASSLSQQKSDGSEPMTDGSLPLKVAKNITWSHKICDLKLADNLLALSDAAGEVSDCDFVPLPAMAFSRNIHCFFPVLSAYFLF